MPVLYERRGHVAVLTLSRPEARNAWGQDYHEGLERKPELILLDVTMPKMDGFEICRRIKRDDSLPFIPIILVTAKTGSKDIVTGLEAGVDEYLTKPVDHVALVAGVKSMLRIKSLTDTSQEQAEQLRVRAEELAVLNAGLQRRARIPGRGGGDGRAPSELTGGPPSAARTGPARHAGAFRLSSLSPAAGAACSSRLLIRGM